MKETFIKKIGLFVLALILVQTSIAQVTIGSGLRPNAGVLLDLKQEADGFSDKGLGMPRVQLQDINKLQMSATAIEHTDKEAHTGLMVYNVSSAAMPQCAPIPDGLYVWDGAKWQGIGIKEIAPPNLNIGSKIYFDLPSGKDARGAISAQSFNVTWSPAQPLPYTKTAASFGDVPFTTTPLTASPLATSPTVFSMTPDAMTIADPTNPWQSKESVLAFTAVDECGGTFAEAITLNQTNYAMKVNSSVEDSNILLKDTNPKNFGVQTNNRWKVTVTDPKGVLATTAPLTGGADNTTSGNSSTTFTYTASAGGAGTKYQTATLTFEDAHATKRAKDITVTTMQCQGTPDVSGLTSVTPTETSGLNIWGNAVIHHQTKPGVYADFLSANFGAAGRWMTTNLTAWKTDGTGVAPAFSFDNSSTVMQMGYPNAGATVNAGSIPPTWSWDQGMLYNWPAAMGRALGAGESPAQGLQGICPIGWHLPTDAEFTLLETYFADNKASHSSTANDGSLTFNGTAWKDVCPLPGQAINPNGTSFPSTNKGFALQLVGHAGNGTTGSHYGDNAPLWSSSADVGGGPGGTTTWSRITNSLATEMTKTAYYSYFLFSVRCKKD